MALAAAIWTVTLSRDAPQLILLGLLTVIALNLSLPPTQGGGGLVPVVVVSGLLMVGLETAVTLFLAAFILAELTRPLWESAAEDGGETWPSRRQRVGQSIVYLLPLLIGASVSNQIGGTIPLVDAEVKNLIPLGSLIGSYGLSYFLLSLLFWLALKRPFPQFLTDIALTNIAYGLLALPVAILGSLTFLSNGLPAFVIFALGVTVFSVVIRLSWQRRLTLEQRLRQFAVFNQAGISLRETLDLTTVLERTHQQILNLVPADKINIFLLDEESALIPHSSFNMHHSDDFTRWVAENGRMLDLDRGNMHFAGRHGLAPPALHPNAWLGIPLLAAEQVIGVIVLQRLAPGRPFSQWHRELLLAIAGQASAAIQNARLYSRTDKALARRVEQLQALLDGMQEGVLLVDVNGRIALINPFAAALLNQPPVELHRQFLTSVMSICIGYAKGAWAARLNALSARQEPAAEPATFTTQLSGKSRFILRQETAVRAADGQVMGWLILFRDVTEERELAEQRADLTRMIVHDLRNPLTTLLSTLQLVEDQSDPDRRDLVFHARQGTLDMLDMVDSLMDINRMEAGQLMVEAEAMRLPPLAEKVVTRLRPLAAQKQITLQFDNPPDLPAVWADAEIVRRVLINLLDNGLKFTPAGGRVNGRFQPEPPLTGQHEPGVRCLIQDSGPGIPPDFRSQVFDRYTRTNPGGALVRGAGLGLAFCKLAIEAHNGRIWVEDAPHGGSQFVFTLPGIPNLETGDW